MMRAREARRRGARSGCQGRSEGLPRDAGRIGGREVRGVVVGIEGEHVGVRIDDPESRKSFRAAKWCGTSRRRGPLLVARIIRRHALRTGDLPERLRQHVLDRSAEGRVGRNSPQLAPKGLYAEVLSGTAFTAPRAENQSTWLYKLRPSAMHGPYKRIKEGSCARDRSTRSRPCRTACAGPAAAANEAHRFSAGLATIAGSGVPRCRSASRCTSTEPTAR